jgi:hypothetical protein
VVLELPTPAKVVTRRNEYLARQPWRYLLMSTPRPNSDMVATIHVRLCCREHLAWNVHCPWTGVVCIRYLPEAPEEFPHVTHAVAPNGGTLIVVLLGYELSDPADLPAVATSEGAGVVAHLNRALQQQSAPVAPPPPPRPKPPKPLVTRVSRCPSLEPCPPSAFRQTLRQWGYVAPTCSNPPAPATVAAAFTRLFGVTPRRQANGIAVYSERELELVEEVLAQAEVTAAEEELAARARGQR